MAGIGGKIGKKPGPGEMEKILTAIRHRGPDNLTIRSFPNGGVGCCEMLTSTEKTPAFSGQEHPPILLDGQIYNSRPEGLSDVDLIRQLYRKHGKKCFSMLDGHFALAILDGSETILARDPLGVKSLVYGKNQKKELYFSSEAKSLIDYLSKVSILPAGKYYSTKEGLKSYEPFSPKIPKFDPENPKEAAAAVKEVMIEAVEKRLKDKAIGGIALSGGLDSSIVTAITVKYFDLKLPQFTGTIKRYPGGDLPFSQIMAKYYGLQKKHYIAEISDEDIVNILPEAVWYLESFDQDCISGWIANYYTAKKAVEFSNCVFVGETADEISGGYFGELEAWHDKWSTLPKMRKVFHKLIEIAGDTGLKRLNQGWHAASVTPRTPFPDAKLVEVFKAIPMKWKYNENCNRKKEVPEVPEKWILRKAFEDDLPQRITWRKKMRFARGVGVDHLMDELAGQKVSEKKFKQMPRTPISNLKLGSRKERYYYDLFIKQFPMDYENLTVRWDPFIDTEKTNKENEGE